MEQRLSVDGYESTASFHEGRPAAHHVDEDWHKGRFDKTVEFIRSVDVQTLTDLGAGDGGLLSVVDVPSKWGYDFHVPNVEYANTVRGVSVENVNFVENIDRIDVGDMVVMTEVVEHLDDPHGLLGALAGRAKFLVMSSPVNETVESHCAEHVWAWDFEGYETLLESTGWTVLRHEVVFPYQVVLATVADA